MKKLFFFFILFFIILTGCTDKVSNKKNLLISCPDTFTDIRDGQIYSLIKIGNQCWMKDTLKIGKVKKFNSKNETNISEDYFLSLDNNIIEKYCQFENTEKCNNNVGYYYI